MVPKATVKGQEARLGPGPRGNGGHPERRRTLLQCDLLFHITPCGHDLQEHTNTFSNPQDTVLTTEKNQEQELILQRLTHTDEIRIKH